MIAGFNSPLLHSLLFLNGTKTHAKSSCVFYSFFLVESVDFRFKESWFELSVPNSHKGFLSLLSYASSSLSTSLFLHFLFFFSSSLPSGAMENESKRWVRFIARFFLFVYIYIYFFFSLIAFLCIFFTFHVPFPSFFIFLFVLSIEWCCGEWK